MQIWVEEKLDMPEIYILTGQYKLQKFEKNILEFKGEDVRLR